jgi:hypothetical protein
LTYFLKAQWSPNWIEVAEKIVREEFDRYTSIEAGDGEEDTEHEDVVENEQVSYETDLA